MDKKRSNSIIRFELFDHSRIKYSFDRNISRANIKFDTPSIKKDHAHLVNLSSESWVTRYRASESVKVESQEAGRQANAS